MGYALFLDDERDPPAGKPPFGQWWAVVRHVEDAKNIVRAWGMPIFASFDHDLGGDETAMQFVHWLIDRDIIGVYRFPKHFSYIVHSQNPVGKANIEGLLNSYFSHREDYS